MLHLTFINEVHNKLTEHGFDPIKWEIRSLTVVNSTNDYIQKLFKMNAERAIVLSRVQQKGRGRNQHTWESPDGGIWLSIGLKQRVSIIELSTPIVETVANYLSAYVKCEIKPPNDILIGGKKVCGVLVETKMMGDKMSEVIIGIGINIENDIPEIIQDIATPLNAHAETKPVYLMAAELTIDIIKKLKELELI